MTDIHYTSSDGLDLYARSYGAETSPVTVLCMHGLTRNHKDFEPMIAALPAGLRYVSVDVRGRGHSGRSPDPGTYNPAVYAGDMIALLDRLQIDRAVLVGTSMGGLMAMMMARAAPDRIRGIVLNDVGPVVERSGLQRIAGYTGKPGAAGSWSEAAQHAGEVHSVAFPEYQEEDWLAFAKRTCREDEAGKIVADYDPAITQSLGESAPGLVTGFFMWRLFSKLKRYPLLVIRGERSDILSEKTAKRMVRRHPDASLVTIPGRGHAPMLDEPAAVDGISRFLKRMEAGA